MTTRVVSSDQESWVCPLSKKDYVLTLLVAGLPIAQRKTYLTQNNGGGG